MTNVLPFLGRPSPVSAEHYPRTRLTCTIGQTDLVVIEREIEDRDSYLGWVSIPGTQAPLTRCEIRSLIDQLVACDEVFAEWDEGGAS